MRELDAEVRRRFDDELPGVHKKVLARSVVFAKDSRVLAVFGGDPHTVAKDLVQKAIERMLDGRRNWDPNKVDLERYLVQTVRSVADSYKREGSRRGPTFDEEIGQNIGADAPRPQLDPHQLLEAKEANEVLENELIAAAGNDVELLQLVDALLSGVYRPRELSTDLVWDINKVYVLTRKLKRRIIAADRERRGNS